MRDKDWSSLIHSIERGKCILMLGPRVATEMQDGVDRPLFEILAEELADHLESVPVATDRSNILEVAERYRVLRQVRDLDELVWSFYSKRRGTPSPPVFDDLAALPFQTVLSTSHDDFLSNSFNARPDKQCEVDYYHSGTKRPLHKMGTIEAPLIYQLFGSIEEEESLVLSETALLDFLVSVISEKPPLPDALRALMQERNQSFLFLGFDFDHWQMRILLHVLHGNDRRSRSLALDAFGSADVSEGQSHSVFYGDGFGINFENTNAAEFARELRARYADSGRVSAATSSSSVRTVEVEPPPDAPSVFICHASEDAAAAATLADQLRAGGLDPWLDKEQIGGGARWDDLIEKTIGEVSYFVVLQSESMVKQQESYFFTEIDLAIKRTSRIRKDLQVVFILPAAIDDCERLPMLSEWQTHDLRSDKGAANLIKEIRRDVERRNR